MTPSKAKEAAEDQRALSRMGEGAERPDRGSDFGIAVGILLVVVAIGFVLWWFRVIPGWHP